MLQIILAFILWLPVLAWSSIKDHSRRVGFAVVNETHNYSLKFEPTQEIVPSEVIFRPNTTNLSGIQLTAFGLTLAYLTSDVFTEDSIERFGKTSYEDIRGALFLGKKDQFIITGYYNRYKGLYIENSEEIGAGITSDMPRLQREDIEVFNSGVALTYVLQPKQFSAAAALVQSAQQKKSGGSWLVKTSFDVTTMKGEFPFIPFHIASLYGTDANMDEGKFGNTSIQIGYGYTLVWKNLFLMGTLLLGRGFQAREYEVDGEVFKSNDEVNKTTIAASTGFNGDDFFASVAYVADSTVFETESIKIENVLDSFRAVVGVRLR